MAAKRISLNCRSASVDTQQVFGGDIDEHLFLWWLISGRRLVYLVRLDFGGGKELRLLYPDIFQDEKPARQE